MKTIFKDINLALNHLQLHEGYDEIKRNGKEYSVYNRHALHLLAFLLSERGTTPEAQKLFEQEFFIDENRDERLLNYLFSHGEPTCHVPAVPGQLFYGKAEDEKEYYGAVLKADAEGNAVEFMTIADNLITRKKILIPIANFYDQYMLSTDARVVEQQDMAEFYGKDGEGLRTIIQNRYVDSNNRTFSWAGRNFTLSHNNTHDLVKFLAWQAPLWLKLRLFTADSIPELTNVLNTLGEGIQAYKKGTFLPFGTILILQNNSAGVVVSHKADKSINMIIKTNDYRHQFFYLQEEEVISYWIPSVKPKTYVTNAQNDAFADLNKFVGHLQTLPWQSVRTEGALFKRQEIVYKDFFTEPFCEFLNKGPGSYFHWAVYLSGFGKGLYKYGSVPIEPGDLLFTLVNNNFNLAFAINDKQILTTNTYNEYIHSPVGGEILYGWRPSLTPRP